MKILLITIGLAVGFIADYLLRKAMESRKRNKQRIAYLGYMENRYDRERAFLQFLTVISITISIVALILSALRLLVLKH